MSSRAWMSAQSVSFSNVPVATIVPVRSRPNYEKGKGVKSGFLDKKALKCNVEGQNGQIELRGT